MGGQTYTHLPPLNTFNAALQFDSGASGSLSITFVSCKGIFEFVFVDDQGSVTISPVEDVKGRQSIVLEKADGTKEIEEMIDRDGVSEEVKAFLEVESGGEAQRKSRSTGGIGGRCSVESLLCWRTSAGPIVKL